MKKPKLKDYGLKGLDSRPQIDLEVMPMSAEERERALAWLIEWQVGNFRAQAFRAALGEWEWANGGR